MNLAQPYVDSKTIVDKPTNGTAERTLAEFNAIDANGPGSITEGQIVQFLDQDFVRFFGGEFLVVLLDFCIVLHTCRKAKDWSSKPSNSPDFNLHLPFLTM